MSNTTLATTNNTQQLTMPAVNTFDYSSKIAALTPAEKTKLTDISNKIKLNDMSTISHYGAELSATVASNGVVLLDAVKGNSSLEVVNMANDLLAQLNMIDIDELGNQSAIKRFLRSIPILRKLVTSVENISIKYKSISERVDEISHKIGAAKAVALRDNGTLENIYNNNILYIGQLRDLILAAKLKESEIANTISDMMEQPDVYDAYQLNDANNFKNSLSKKIADMVTTEYILQQNLFQIRATQSNNIAIADKSDTIVNHIIPTWRSQLAIAIINNNQKANIEAQKKFTDTTNAILRKNAEALKINSINVAKASEESVVSMDTLRETTQNLIDTITEVRRIHAEGAKERANMETKLIEYSKKLENVIMEESVSNSSYQ
jgi:uncharacterized protein YaaN involved in tellurite resistance